nr:hypothetical protein [Escherichia coli]
MGIHYAKNRKHLIFYFDQDSIVPKK